MKLITLSSMRLFVFTVQVNHANHFFFFLIFNCRQIDWGILCHLIRHCINKISIRCSFSYNYIIVVAIELQKIFLASVFPLFAILLGSRSRSLRFILNVPFLFVCLISFCDPFDSRLSSNIPLNT